MMIAIFSAVCAYFASWLGHAFLQWIQALHRWQRRGNCFALLPLTKAALYSFYPFLTYVVLMVFAEACRGWTMILSSLGKDKGGGLLPRSFYFHFQHLVTGLVIKTSNYLFVFFEQ